MISTEMLASFVRVAEEGSVSRAAEGLGVSKSAVSKRIGQLERSLATSLFSRSTRRVALTPAGESYLEHARRALAELEAGEEQILSMRHELVGQIRLTAPVSWGQRVLARCLPAFLREHPGVDVELQLADRLVDVAYERLDLALRWTTDDPSDLSCVPVASIGWVLVAAPAYLAEAGVPDSPVDLPQRPCLGYWREPVDEIWRFCREEQSLEVTIRTRYRVDHADAVAEAALAGLGIALLPHYSCAEALEDGRLTQVLSGWTPRTRFGSLVVAMAPPERLRLARNRALVDFLRDRLLDGT